MSKKQLVCRCAIEIMSKEGFEKTTIQSIAEAAGVSVGTIYNYFENKEDILNCIFKMEYEKRLTVLDILENSDNAIKDKIKIFLDFHFNEIVTNSNTVRFIIQESMSPFIHKIEWIGKSVSATQQSFEKMLRNAIEKEEIRKLDATLIGSSILSIARDIMYTAATIDNIEDVEKKKKELLDFIMNGLK